MNNTKDTKAKATIIPDISKGLQSESILDKIYSELENHPARGAWNKGVKEYAFELLARLKDRSALEGRNPESGKEAYNWMLNGADNWREYSYDRSSLLWDEDIAERLCSPSELKKKKYGYLNPNKIENWLDFQARALYQACNLVLMFFPYESEDK